MKSFLFALLLAPSLIFAQVVNNGAVSGGSGGTGLGPNEVLATPDGSAGSLSMRPLVPNDVPQLTPTQMPALTGDVTAAAGTTATTVTSIGGVPLAGLSTGLLKFTGGVPSVAVGGVDYQLAFGQLFFGSFDVTGVKDTAALQTAVDKFTVAGCCDLTLVGPVSVNAPIAVPFATGWHVHGVGQQGTPITQVTDNTPIFTITHDLTHTWEIDHVTFQWLHNQPGTATLANAIQIDAGHNANIMNWKLHDFNFVNGHRLVNAIGGTSIWGFFIHDFTAGPLHSGAILYGNEASVGQPKPIVRDGYINSTTSSATEPEIIFSQFDSMILEGLEFNGGVYGTGRSSNQIAVGTGAVVLIGDRTEAVGSDGPAHTAYWNFSNAHVTAINVACAAIVTGSAGYATFISSGSNGSLSVDVMNYGGTGTGVLLFPYAANSLESVGGITPSGTIATKELRQNLGNVQMPRLDLDRMTQNSTTQRGDADLTLLITDSRVNVFGSTFTANHIVTLPTPPADGYEFDIIRDATTPGPYTLTVRDPSNGRTWVLPAGSNGAIHVRSINNANWKSTGVNPYTELRNDDHWQLAA